MEYSDYLLNEADKYYSDCQPHVVETEWEWEDGAMVPYYICSCKGCDQYECSYWLDYNNEEDMPEEDED